MFLSYHVDVGGMTHAVRINGSPNSNYSKFISGKQGSNMSPITKSM
ncbi:MAG TPA: hypothetical protein P5239_02835 [Victivallales bacterium]|nr:hypothetical protein [Victivallales bacterium]